MYVIGIRVPSKIRPFTSICSPQGRVKSCPSLALDIRVPLKAIAAKYSAYSPTGLPLDLETPRLLNASLM